jgi:hypothetical protein
MNALGLWVVLLPALSWADAPCELIERGFERFDLKKSAWVETSELVLLQCGAATRVELREGATVVSSTVVPAPGKGQHWALDGLACAEKGRAPTRNHVVLFEHIEKPAAVWAVNEKTRQWQAVDVKKVSCSKDEP